MTTIVPVIKQFFLSEIPTVICLKLSTYEYNSNLFRFAPFLVCFTFRPKGNLKMGLVGLPNVGKSTTFNLLSKQAVPAENYPFCTIGVCVCVCVCVLHC